MKRDDFKMPDGWRAINPGELLESGDVYGVGFEFVIGGPHTDLRAGDRCPEFIMTFHPRRKIK